MALDLKLFTPRTDGSLSATTWPQADYVDGSYALIQRISKCLYTIPGTDLFDPTFGLDVVGALQDLSPTDVTTAAERMAGVARDCEAQIKPLFASSSDPSQRLRSISVTSVTFNDKQLAWDVSLEVSTEDTTIKLNL